MWNKFLGKGDASRLPPPPSAAAAPASAAAGGGSPHATKDVGAAAALPTPLTAVVRRHGGGSRRVSVTRLLVQGVHVGAPARGGGGGVDGASEGGRHLANEEAGGGAAATEVGGGPAVGRQNLDRSLSGSTSHSKTDSSSHHTAATATTDLEEPAAAKPPSGDGAPTDETLRRPGSVGSEDDDDGPDDRRQPAPRTRSASLGDAGELGAGTTEDGGDGARPSSSSASSPDRVAGGAAAGAPSATGGSTFEATLLLSIADAAAASPPAAAAAPSSSAPPPHEKEKRSAAVLDPKTLPASMTSFLDLMTDDHRKRTHRYLPGADGFRKLFRSEVRADMSEARKVPRAAAAPATVAGGEDGDEGEGAADAMDVEAEDPPAPTEHAADGGAADAGGEKDETEEKEDRKKKRRRMPARGAFVAPSKELRACADGGHLAGAIAWHDLEHVPGEGAAAPAANATGVSPNGARATQGGLDNDAASPGRGASLTSYNPPRPRESQADGARRRRARWEAHPTAAAADLATYATTVRRTRAELRRAGRARAGLEQVAGLLRSHAREHLRAWKEEVGACRAALAEARGGCLRALEEVERGAGGGKGKASTRKGHGTATKGMKEVFDAIKTLGEDLKNAGGPGKEVPAPPDWRIEGVGGVSCGQAAADGDPVARGWILPGDHVIMADTGEAGTVLHVKGPAADQNEDVAGAPGKSAPGGRHPLLAYAPALIVKAARNGEVREMPPANVAFDPARQPSRRLTAHTSDAALAQRWEDMRATALAHGVGRDVRAMRELEGRRGGPRGEGATVEAAAAREEDGGSSPTSVTRYDDGERSLLPFGAGLLAAPEEVRDYPSVIPWDTLEESVRQVVYEADKPRAIPSSLSTSIRKYEAEREETNILKGKVLQLRNRLTRQKLLRRLNERILIAGKSKADKLEDLLLEMQMDLSSLKERLQDELHEIGIDNNLSSPRTSTPEQHCMMDHQEMEDGDNKPISMVVGGDNVSIFNEDSVQQEPYCDPCKVGLGADDSNVNNCDTSEPGIMNATTLGSAHEPERGSQGACVGE